MSSELCYYATGFDLKIFLRARKVSWPFEKWAPGLEKSWIQLVLYSGKQLSHVHGLHGATHLHVLVSDLVIEGDLLRPSPIVLVKSYNGP